MRLVSLKRSLVRRLAGGLGVVLIAGGMVGFGPSGPAAATEPGPLVSDNAAVLQVAGEVFSDIADAGGHQANVETLSDRGILEGTECGPGQFCPRDPIQRWVMAVWLVRAVDGGDPADPGSSRFEDVDVSQWWSPFVERLADLGITRGCSTEPARFCPTDPVTRQQMASFLVRAFQLEPEPENKFTDVEDDNSHLVDINGLAAAGITAGCATEPARFCPGEDTTRAEMATFLARALGIATTPPLEENTPSEETTPPLDEELFTAIAVGWDHTCGIRADRTIVCWGHNWATQAEAPDGEFTAVAAGRTHSCGVNTNQNVVCWGQSHFGKANAPEGLFTAVTAGGDHSCAIRTDQTVTCWGNNEDGQADPPQGEFIAVAAGERHTCGLLDTDRTLACWGDNGNGQADPPQGKFAAVVSGNWYSCGLTSEGKVTCWGGNWAGQTDVPAQSFSFIAAGWEHSCGIVADGSVNCWGHDAFGRANPPEGEYAAVALGDRHSCGLRTNGTITCWGRNSDDRTLPVQTEFVTITAGASHGCGLLSDQTISCWGRHWANSVPPAGKFTALAAGSAFSCAIGLDQTLACWGTNRAGQSDPPEGEYIAVTAGWGHACSIGTDQTIACWGDNEGGQASPPEGEFTAIAAGASHTCGLHSTDQTLVCWGHNEYGQASPPEGQFTAIATGDRHSCGLRTDGVATCWGYEGNGPADPPEGEFEDIAAGREHSCGRLTDQAIVCWGSNRNGESKPPNTPFTTVTAGNGYSCGLNPDRTLECWGLLLVLPAPGGVLYATPTTAEVDVADDSTTPSSGDEDHPGLGACQPYGPAGFPLPGWAAPSVGALRVAVLFMDFPGTPASHSTEEEAALGLPFIENYLKTMSYGRLEIEFGVLHGWLRAQHDYHSYPGGYALFAEAIGLVDTEFDFTGYHSLMIVLPSSHFGNGFAGGRVGTEEGFIPTTTMINAFPLDSPRRPYEWRLVGAHELAHNLGLLDLYPADPVLRQHPQPPEGRRWVDNQIGLMGLWANFAAIERDSRLAHVWIHQDGYRSTAYAHVLQAPEMLAWSRWQLGWLNPTQIRCLADETEATITLHPVAFPGTELAMVGIPLSETELVVIESRRRVGYDIGDEYIAPDGAKTTWPVLPAEGVLIYTVNASLGNGQRPLSVISYPGNAYAERKPIHFNDTPFLWEGQSITIGGYTITVQSSYYQTDVITVTKTGSSTDDAADTDE